MALKKAAKTVRTTGQNAAKSGKAASAQDSAGLRATESGQYHVTGSSTLRVGGRDLPTGHKVSAKDFITKRDPDGMRGLQRLLDGGELGSDEPVQDRAGGGSIENGGARGAGPSAAQIQAAEEGNDPAATEVVVQALTGSKDDFTAAADPDAAKEADKA